MYDPQMNNVRKNKYSFMTSSKHYIYNGNRKSVLIFGV